MGTKRKSRKTKLSRTDITVPISVDLLGTKSDPCFAKHYDGKAPECRRCGDSEVCLIGMGQKNTVERTLIESTQRFKDIEPEEFKINLPLVHKLIESEIATSKEGIVLVSKIKKLTLKTLCPKNLDIDDVKLAIKRVMKNSITLEYTKVNEIKYIKTKE